MSSDTSNPEFVPPTVEAIADAPTPAVYAKGLPWGPLAGLVVTIIAFVVAQLAAGLAIGFWPRIAHWDSAQASTWLDGVAGQFFFVALAEGLTVLMLWWFLRTRRASFRLLGYLRRPRWSDLGWASGAFCIYFIVMITAITVASAVFHIDAGQKQDLGFNDLIGGGEKLMAFVSLVILPPFVEETLFRGFLFGGLRKKLKLPAAMIITSLLFALPHLFESTSVLWVAGIDTFILSLALCFVREKTGNLYAGIVLHMAKNSLAFLALYVFVGH